MSTAVVLFLGFLLPLAAGWFALLWGRPAVARARVEYEALRIRDRVMDGILSGDISKDDPRAQDVLKYCDFLADHSRELSLSVACAVWTGMREAGIDPHQRAQEKAASRVGSFLGTEGGRRRLQEAEAELDHSIARYFVHGSTLWWILSPAQRVTRYLRSRQSPSLDVPIPADPPKPGELATKVREASRGQSFPPALWTVHGLKTAS
ncbi:hypothetical protein EV580_1369 [Mycobacterium sp. BK086]|nr:hypothetical protein EV580_1369 [Mycobacterium sp. BK086]